MARLTLARKIAAISLTIWKISLTIWKKGVDFDAQWTSTPNSCIGKQLEHL